jgi:glycosyltransferase involved in cell wall biosynthesis
MRGVDVVVHASTSPEPFGLVVGEAMACGRAVLVGDSGGVAELVSPEHDALAYRTGSVDAMTAGITRLIDDAALRTRLGAAARASAMARFSPDRAWRQMLEVYARFERAEAA